MKKQFTEEKPDGYTKLYYSKPESLSAAIPGERRGIVNRKILFRGKRVDNGAWETGSFVGIRIGCSDERTYIADKMTGYNTPVIPETVGQYTGLTDKGGRMIFEGDIIKQYEKTQFGDPVSDFGLIKWDNKECMLFRTSTRIGKDRLVTSRDIYEVVGNIHDNPDLLEVSDNG